jgi:hypothetical protein
MRKRMRWTIGALVMTLALSAPALPQAASSAAQPTPLSVKVQIVITKGEGDKKVSTPYMLMTSSSGENSVVRLGAEVPIVGPAPDGQTRMTLQQFGTQIECAVTATDDGRFKLALTLTRRFFSPDGQPRTFVLPTIATLRDGESAQFMGSDKGDSAQGTISDKSAGETFTVDVTLTVVK